MHGEPTRSKAYSSAAALLAYCQRHDWSGYDPYDALNSRVYAATPLVHSRISNIALTQFLKRSPVNLRGALLVPRTENAKGTALFLAALIRLSRCGFPCEEPLVERMIGRIAALRSAGTPYWCWGYSFPWQTRTHLVPRGAPNLVCTTFVAHALLDAYESTGDSSCLSMAVSAAEYLLHELHWSEGQAAGFSYPLKALRVQVHNANFLGAALLCRVARLSGEGQFLEPALKAARYSAAMQHPDGSWDYGELPTQRWVDNFHTGYNLCSLYAIGGHARTAEFEETVERGLAFYLRHFFREDGAPRYFHDRTYPLDVHCVAQSIITLLALREVSPQCRATARAVFEWGMKNMWDGERFYYQVRPLYRNKISYMRWSQAWMLLALSTLIEHEGL